MKRTLTFGQKLGAGFGAVVVLALVMAGIGLYAVNTIVETKDYVIRNTDADLIDAEQLRAAMHKQAANFRAFLLTGEESFAAEMRSASEEFQAALTRIQEREQSLENQRLRAAISSAQVLYKKEFERIARERRSHDDIAVVLRSHEDHVLPKFDALREKVRDFIAISSEQRETARRKASETADRANDLLVVVSAIVVLLAALLATLLTRTLSRQIGAIVQHVRSSSGELQAAATQQASGAKEQASAMTEITTTIGELLATSRQIAESGQHVSKMASDSSQRARDGGLAVVKAQEAVGNIKLQVETIVQHMLDLGRKSQQIGGILEIINELAEQTNILAINATIEASGAGEAGRRFSVVGEEIRKLADRVGNSTKEIRALIEEIRAAVNATVMATETGSKTVESGTERFRELQAAFTRIGDIVTSTMEAGKEIELSTKQQTTAVEQVNVAVTNVAQTTKEVEASSGQTLQTASELASLSDQLARLVTARSG